jgi:hypothetical protein
MAQIQPTYSQNTIPITQNTEKLFLRRAENDFRLDYAHYILFSEHGIRDDISASEFEGEKVSLRQAIPGDLFTYFMIPDDNAIRSYLEGSLSNIAKLRAGKELPFLKRIWMFSYEIDKEKVDDNESLPVTVAYINPNASDINKLLKENVVVIAAFLALEFEMEGAPNTRIEWTFLSSMDPSNIAEYERVYEEKEIESYERLFLLKFK